jgi:hypothetical protein
MSTKNLGSLHRPASVGAPRPLPHAGRSSAPVEKISRGLRRRSASLGTLIELGRVVVRGGRLWLLPMLLVLAATAVLFTVLTLLEYVAPLVYTVF